jgi:hypothetical protein
MQVTFSYDFSNNSSVQLDIFNLSGMRIYTMTQAGAQTGKQAMLIDVSGLAPGLYMYTLRASTEIVTGKFIKTD